MSTIPAEHIADSHKMIADGIIELFELVPAGGSGVIRFKADNDVTWRSNLYNGLPMGLSGEKMSADSGLASPRLTLGQNNVDLSLFKPLIFDGSLDNAVVTRIKILKDDMINNRLIRRLQIYRVKRVESYTRTNVILQLATFSDSLGFQLPYRAYTQPSFPSVQAI
jgi:phage-related protein